MNRYTVFAVSALCAVVCTFFACGRGGGETAASASAPTGPVTLESFRGDWLKKPSSNTAAKQIIIDSGFYAGNVFVFYEGSGGYGITGSFLIRERGNVTESGDGFDLALTGASSSTVGDLDIPMNKRWSSAAGILFHLSADGQTLTWDLDGSEFTRRQ
jgi:hypothetical protein